MQLKIEDVAKICHEANRAYCETIGDKSQLPWELAPSWQKSGPRMGVAFLCAFPDAGPEASHEKWMSHKIADGWKHGEVKDPNAKTHPCIVPFADLPIEQRLKDVLFHSIVRALLKENVIDYTIEATMSKLRLRTLTTGLLHTEPKHVYEDIKFFTGVDVLTTQMADAVDSMQPILKRRLHDGAYWNGKVELHHTGWEVVRSFNIQEREEFWVRFNALCDNGALRNIL